MILKSKRDIESMIENDQEYREKHFFGIVVRKSAGEENLGKLERVGCMHFESRSAGLQIIGHKNNWKTIILV